MKNEEMKQSEGALLQATKQILEETEYKPISKLDYESKQSLAPVSPIDKASATQVYVQGNVTVHVPPVVIEAKEEHAKPPIEVKVSVNNHGALYSIGRYCYKQIDDCWFIHLRSNAPFNYLFLRTLRRDLKVIYHGHSSIDSLDWLGYQSLPIQSTLDSIGEGGRVKSNFFQLRLILWIMLGMWLFALLGYSADVVSLFAQPWSGFTILNHLHKLAFLLLVSYLYYAYAYHCYALSIDRFVLKRDFNAELKKFSFRAWFPFFSNR
ncbi:hypothetical protein L1D14_20530 [Vibrio tubiashii]|uniref:hypothetical protein n=1 Tax=Vibrio tubiashii TaxID=29498 RepID=UPI001EFCCDE3|nr:hypothetical protein [Vibrio tubiashii]MCG9578608.1 hypothetical protein [Vibrio tubiashii]